MKKFQLLHAIVIKNIIIIKFFPSYSKYGITILSKLMHWMINIKLI